MTPPATTAGGGRATGNVSREAATDSDRRPARRSTTPKLPRRLSGPIGGRGTASKGGRFAGRPAQPSSRSSRPTRVRAGSAVAQTLAARALSIVRALPDHPLLDRVVRGRAWIPLLGVLLAGIVAMQVEELKLGASIGRSIERSSALEGRNEQLRASVSELSDQQRIERVASGMGMIMPPPGAVGFLSANQSGSVQRALANVRAPDPSAFTLQPSTNGAVVLGPDQTAATLSTESASSVTGAASATQTATTATQTAAPATGASATQTATAIPTGPGAQDTSPAQAAPVTQPGSTSGTVSAP